MEVSSPNKKLSLNERINQIWSTTQGKTYTTAIATIVVVVLMAMFAIVPAYTSITDQLALNEQKTKYLADLSTKQQALNKLIMQRDEYSVPITLLGIYLREKMNNELLIASFSKIADDNKCKLSSVSFSEADISKNITNVNVNVRAVPFSVTISCKVGDIKTVYAEMMNFPVPLNITNLSYSNKKEVGGGGTSNLFYDRFVVTINGEYYFWQSMLALQ